VADARGEIVLDEPFAALREADRKVLRADGADVVRYLAGSA
jgi:ABC-type nitrate/sulfonate/bicarbonate transport system ATPase subunit